MMKLPWSVVGWRLNGYKYTSDGLSVMCETYSLPSAGTPCERRFARPRPPRFAKGTDVGSR